MPKTLIGLDGWTLTGALVAAVLAGCAGGEEQPAMEEDQADATSTVQVVEGQRSQVAYPDASVDLTVEETDGARVVRLAVLGFEAGVPTEGASERGLAISPDGQHLHVIVDDQPYMAVYDPSQPVSLGDLEPGPHVVRAFPSRQWHESVKEPGAFAMQEFAVGGVGGPSAVPPDRPLLTYSRPKGSYQGADADSIMVDFYLTDVDLEPGGHRVRLTVDDQVTHEITEWKPYFLVGLTPGDHTVTLELLDPAGRLVEGPYNRTTRTITVTR